MGAAGLMGPLVRVPLLTLAALILQASLFAELRLFDVSADAMLLLAVAAGIVGGPERGAVVGFAAGLAFDLLLTTPFGMSALAYTFTGYGVGLVQSTILRAAWWIPVVTAALASAAGVVVYVLVGAVVGESGLLEPRLATIIGVVALFNGCLGAMAIPAMRWALSGGAQARAYLR